MKKSQYQYKFEDVFPLYKSSTGRSEQELREFLDYVVTHSEEGIRNLEKIDETLGIVSKSLEDSIKNLKIISSN